MDSNAELATNTGVNLATLSADSPQSMEKKKSSPLLRRTLTGNLKLTELTAEEQVRQVRRRFSKSGAVGLGLGNVGAEDDPADVEGTPKSHQRPPRPPSSGGIRQARSPKRNTSHFHQPSTGIETGSPDTWTTQAQDQNDLAGSSRLRRMSRDSDSEYSRAPSPPQRKSKGIGIGGGARVGTRSTENYPRYRRMSRDSDSEYSRAPSPPQRKSRGSQQQAPSPDSPIIPYTPEWYEQQAELHERQYSQSPTSSSGPHPLWSRIKSLTSALDGNAPVEARDANNNWDMDSSRRDSTDSEASAKPVPPPRRRGQQ